MTINVERGLQSLQSVVITGRLSSDDRHCQRTDGYRRTDWLPGDRYSTAPGTHVCHNVLRLTFVHRTRVCLFAFHPSFVRPSVCMDVRLSASPRRSSFNCLSSERLMRRTTVDEVDKISTLVLRHNERPNISPLIHVVYVVSIEHGTCARCQFKAHTKRCN